MNMKPIFNIDENGNLVDFAEGYWKSLSILDKVKLFFYLLFGDFIDTE